MPGRYLADAYDALYRLDKGTYHRRRRRFQALTTTRVSMSIADRDSPTTNCGVDIEWIEMSRFRHVSIDQQLSPFLNMFSPSGSTLIEKNGTEPSGYNASRRRLNEVYFGVPPKACKHLPELYGHANAISPDTIHVNRSRPRSIADAFEQCASIGITFNDVGEPVDQVEEPADAAGEVAGGRARRCPTQQICRRRSRQGACDAQRHQ